MLQISERDIIQDLVKQFKEWQQQRTDESERSEEKFNEKLAELKADITNKMNKKLKHCRERLHTTQQDLNNAKTQLAVYQQQTELNTTALNKTIATLENDKKKLQRTIDSKISQIRLLDVTIVAKDIEIEANETSNREFQNKNQTLKTQNRDLEKALQELKKKKWHM